MNLDERKALEPHAARPIRAFLRDPGDAEGAFWTLVYGRTVVTHATAIAVAAELEASGRKVGDLLGGWRPAALGAT